MIRLDHLVISGKTLDEATYHIESRLGVKLQEGGCHDRFGTHNRLLNLSDGIYLEAIAIDSRAENPSYPRWFSLDTFDEEAKITNWVCRSENINLDFKNIFFKNAEILQLERDKLEWLMALPKNGNLPFDGAFPALLQWKTNPPTNNLIQSGCTLKHMTIFHPEAVKLRKKIQVLYDPRISFEMHNRVEFFAEFHTPNGIRTMW